MVLLIEVPLAAIALVLGLLSWRTLRTIRHLDVGKSFWIPVLLSGVFFFAGSVAAILNDLGVSFVYGIEIISGSRLLALCVLLGGVSTYSRQISRNLAQHFIIPAPPTPEESQKEAKPAVSIVDRLEERKTAKDHSCKHDLGYLKTLPKSSPIPDECLSCTKIIECKHSYLKRPESKHRNSSEFAGDVVASEVEYQENAGASLY